MDDLVPQVFIVKESKGVHIVRKVPNAGATRGTNKGPSFVVSTLRNMAPDVPTMGRCRLIAIGLVVVHGLVRTPVLRTLNSRAAPQMRDFLKQETLLRDLVDLATAERTGFTLVRGGVLG